MWTLGPVDASTSVFIHAQPAVEHRIAVVGYEVKEVVETGTALTYRHTLTNTGGGALRGLRVFDAEADREVCAIAQDVVLKPGDTVSCDAPGGSASPGDYVIRAQSDAEAVLPDLASPARSRTPVGRRHRRGRRGGRPGRRRRSRA